MISNKKAAVKKLNAAHLSKLVNQSDVSLDKLHSISNNDLNKKDNKTNIKMVLLRNSITNIMNDTFNIVLYHIKLFILFIIYFYIKFIRRIIKIILMLLLLMLI